ncbi:MAG: hypothetical protein AAF458_12840 [Pseudomonadota bacterium]
MSKYTWIVTKDELDGNVSEAVGKIGPPGEQHRFRFDRVITGGKEFRLLTDDGQVKYSGFILGEFSGQEPLDEYGRHFGCTSIQYRERGRWVKVGPNDDAAGMQPLSNTG